MKTPIAVALIIMGGLLTLAPAVSDYFWSRNLASVESTGIPGVTGIPGLAGEMGDDSRIAYFVLGGSMIGVAVFGVPSTCCSSNDKP